MATIVAPPKSTGPSIVAPLFVPNASVPNTHIFSRGSDLGVVNTTISNLPYASVTDMVGMEASPYLPALACECGQANPDECVKQNRSTTPYMTNPLSKQQMDASYQSMPYLATTTAQNYLQMRAAPLNL